MTIFAGAVAMRSDGLVSETTVADIRALLSRSPGGAISEFATSRAYLVKLDIGVYEDPAVVNTRRVGVTFLAGHPYLRAADGGWDSVDRGAGLIHDHLLRGDPTCLEQARGVFALAHYDQMAHRLTLATDKMGVRPVYFGVYGDVLLFSTALRVIEGLAQMPKSMDVQAVLELAAFAFPLADRTPYSNVKVLREGELLVLHEGSLERRLYHDWTRLQSNKGAPKDWIAQARHEFEQAITLRAGGDGCVMTTVSGGMDSRTIIALLREQQRTVHAINFSTLGSVDEYCAHRFATNAGCLLHVDTRLPHQRRDWFALLGTALREEQAKFQPRPERPMLVWSGDGGSVGVGAVYLSDAIVEKARSGDVDGAIDAYLAYNKVGPPTASLQAELRGAAAARVKAAVGAELARLKLTDAGVALHLFLMFNDQRRHLSRFYEDIDVNRFEYHLPFFDSVFLAFILSLPLEARLRHRFYNAWYTGLPEVVMTVPWQAYPGHMPCPLPLPDGLLSQWRPEPISFGERCARNLRVAREQVNLLLRSDFPTGFVSRSRLLAGAVATASGLRDVEHMFSTARYFCDYWRKCDGRYAVS